MGITHKHWDRKPSKYRKYFIAAIFLLGIFQLAELMMMGTLFMIDLLISGN